MRINLDWLVIMSPLFLLMVGAFVWKARSENARSGLAVLVFPLLLIGMNPLIIAATVASQTFPSEKRFLVLLSIPVGAALAGAAWWFVKRPKLADMKAVQAMWIVALPMVLAPGAVVLVNGLGGSSEQTATGRVSAVREMGELFTIAAVTVDGVGDINPGSDLPRGTIAVGDQVEVRWTTGLLGARRTLGVRKVAAP